MKSIHTYMHTHMLTLKKKLSTALLHSFSIYAAGVVAAAVVVDVVVNIITTAYTHSIRRCPFLVHLPGLILVLFFLSTYSCVFRCLFCFLFIQLFFFLHFALGLLLPCANEIWPLIFGSFGCCKLSWPKRISARKSTF